jgi:type II secretion system protein G
MNKNFFNHKPGFTLVEMLIVIVIIGILASALIPRLSQARERANDTARKAHIQNIATVLIAYQIDRGSYPTTAGPISAISSQLIGAGLSSVPTDPDANRSFLGIGSSTTNCTASPIGQYMYTPIRKN